MSVDSGSPLYAAPEQYSGEYAVTQSDVYSVGMVILLWSHMVILRPIRAII